VVPPPLVAASAPSIVEAYPKPSAEDNLPMSKNRLHITINIVSRLNAAEEIRSLLVEEPLLREFLLDQIFFLQESLESSLVPRIIEELLGRELIATTPSIEHIPSPLPVGSKVAEGIQWLFAPLSLCQWEPR
jgi:hypothetical protein